MKLRPGIPRQRDIWFEIIWYSSFIRNPCGVMAQQAPPHRGYASTKKRRTPLGYQLALMSFSLTGGLDVDKDDYALVIRNGSIYSPDEFLPRSSATVVVVWPHKVDGYVFFFEVPWQCGLLLINLIDIIWKLLQNRNREVIVFEKMLLKFTF